MILAWWVLLFVVSGCSIPMPFTKPADEVRINRGVLFVTYARANAGLTLLAYKIRLACHAGRLEAVDCRDVETMVEQAKLIDERIQDALLHPVVEIDWAEIARMMRLIVSIAAKAI